MTEEISPGRSRDAADRLDPTLRRLLRWAAIRWTIRVITTVLLVAMLAHVVLGWRHDDRVTVAAGTPDRDRVDQAIRAAEAYIDRLYQPLPDDEAIVSEYVGLPLVAYFPTLDAWVSPGDGGLRIESGEQSRERETYLFHYVLEDGRASDLLVVLRWDPATSGGLLEVSQVGGDDVPVQLGLGSLAVARWDSGSTRQVAVPLDADQLGELRSLRYTVRHVAMLAASLYRYRGRPERAERLQHLVERASYDPDGDVYSPLWGASTGRADDYFYDAAVYPDCQPGALAALPASPRYYPYQSKVCSLPTWGYIAMTREDPLVTTMQAVHVLAAHGSPQARFSDGEHFGMTPTSVAAALEERFRDEVGIGSCLPGSCTTDNSSTLRTAVFGLLETELGFTYGDDVARGYADAVVDDLLEVQVQPDGLVPSLHLGELYRPGQAGGFFTAYDAEHRAGTPDSVARAQIDLVASRLDIRREYLGELATNAETTLVVHAFLVRYRCARFGVGCAGPPASSTS